MHYYRKFLLIIIGTICLYATFLVFSDVKKLEEHSINFNLSYTPIILFLVTLSWVPLYVRWKILLRNVGVKISPKDDILVYVSGFALSVTPGKIGELIRTQLLKERCDVPRTKTTPLIFVEKFYDLAGAMLTSLIGIWFFKESGFIIIGGLALLVVLYVLISSNKAYDKSLSWFAKFKFTAKFIDPLKASSETLKTSTRGKIAIFAILLSVAYWLVTSLAVYFVLLALDVSILSYLTAISTYTSSLFLGAISFIPGGLGVAEGSLATLLNLQGIEISLGIVLAVIIRLFTLWYSVGLGLIALKMVGGFSLRP